jgi:hypothetical protein
MSATENNLAAKIGHVRLCAPKVARFGEIVLDGGGLLGAIGRAINELTDAAVEFGFDENARSRRQLCDRRENVFNLLKQIENAVAEFEENF